MQIFGEGFSSYQTYNFKFENGILQLYDNLASINPQNSISLDSIKVSDFKADISSESFEAMQILQKQPLRIDLEQFIAN